MISTPVSLLYLMCWTVPPITTTMKTVKTAKKMIKLREMPSSSTGGALIIVFEGSSCYCGATATSTSPAFP